jgi:hypothetical protein
MCCHDVAMTRSLWPAVAAALSLASAACGGATDVHQTSGSAGSGAGTTASSSTSGSASSAASSSGAGCDAGCDAGASGPDAYEALSLFTNLPRYAILKASPARDLCFRLTIVTVSGPGLPGFTGNVSVESGIVTHAATDCEVSGLPLPTPATSYPVVSGMGTVTMTGPPGCTTSVHAKLVFSGAPSWVPASEPFDADGLAIVGGCP